MKKLIALAALAAMTSPLWAATQSVTLSVPGMNCATCPITVKKALTKVSGVSKIDVNLDRREARVTFDDAKANSRPSHAPPKTQVIHPPRWESPGDCGNPGIDVDLPRVRPRQDRDHAHRCLPVVLRMRAVSHHAQAQAG